MAESTVTRNSVNRTGSPANVNERCRVLNGNDNGRPVASVLAELDAVNPRDRAGYFALMEALVTARLREGGAR